MTVSSISFANCWAIVTWRLLLGGALVPLGGALLGVLTTAIFRQRLPQVSWYRTLDANGCVPLL